MTVSEATSLIVAKAKEAPARWQAYSKASAMYWAANELWNEEYASYRAIANSSLGSLSSPARCAWDRRCAYVEATNLLRHSW